MNFFKRPPRKAEKFVVLISLTSILFLAKERNSTGILQRQGINVDNLHILSRSQDKVKYKPVSITDFKPTKGTGAEGEFLKRPETIIPASERKPISEIRYAAFGSSSTWGAELENREEECYIWRLSDLDQERGKNLAVRANGPDYPSSCLSTMIGADHFDVVVLEYYMCRGRHLLLLAQRVRERFPDAIIIILRLWAPDRIWRNNNRTHIIPKWAIKHGFKGNYTHDEDFKKAFLETAGDGWNFFEEAKFKNHAQEVTASEVGAYIVSMPFNEQADGPGGWLDIADHFLAHDSFHMSDKGHFWIYTQVKAIVDRVGVPKSPRVGEFSVIDQCHNWLMTGTLDEAVEYSSNGSIVQMPNTKKFSLEFKDQGTDKNWILLENKSAKVVDLSLGYMTTGPPPSKYPVVEAKRSDGGSFILSPDSDTSYGDKPVHITRPVGLGTIAPHTTLRIYFNPKEESEWPFRLVQIMMTPHDGN